MSELRTVLFTRQAKQAETAHASRPQAVDLTWRTSLCNGS